MSKFKIITFGCRTNQYESQAIIEELGKIGWTEASSFETADVAIVNSCVVTSRAEKKALELLKKLLSGNYLKQIVLTGCLAEKWQNELLDERLKIVPNHDKKKLSHFLSGLCVQNRGIESFSGHARAFVKIQDGCDNFCSYCIIPQVRGRSRSRSAQEIVGEITRLTENGYQEIVLTGINAGSYSHEGIDLAGLIELAAKAPLLKRLRIGSIGPDQLDKKLMDNILQNEKFCPHLHLALQSGSDRVLGKMLRKYRIAHFLEKVDYLRERNCDFSFTTDIIIGFPQESEADFAATCDIVKKIQFAHAHIFPYSKRENTLAASMSGQLSKNVVLSRKKELEALAKVAAFQWRQRFVGQNGSVLVEKNNKGYSRHYIHAKILKKTCGYRTIVPVQFIDNQEDALICKLI